MKSIKEKAEEFSFIEEGTDLNGYPYKDYNNYKMDGFEKGANYVLKEIDKSLQEFSNFEDSLIVRRVIEQLKK